MIQRTALQKSSSQFIGGGIVKTKNTKNRVTSALNRKKLLGRQPYNFIESTKNAVSELNKESTLKYARARSATYRVLKKDESIWNDYVQTPKKVVKYVFTETVLQGEDQAIEMISMRQNESEKAEEDKKRYRQELHDEIYSKRQQKHIEFTEKYSRALTSKMSKFSSEFIASPAKDKGSKRFQKKKLTINISKNKMIKPILVKNVKSVTNTPKAILTDRLKYPSFTTQGIEQEEKSSGDFIKNIKAEQQKKVKLTTSNAPLRRTRSAANVRRPHKMKLKSKTSGIFPSQNKEYQITVSQDFRNMPVKDAVLNALVENNNYLQNLVDRSKYAKKLQKKGFERGCLSVQKGSIRCQSAGTSSKYRNQDHSNHVFNFRKSHLKSETQKILRKKPVYRKYMSKDAWKKAHLKQFKKDTLADNLGPLDNMHVSVKTF